MATVQFQGTLESGPGGGAYVRLPEDVLAALDRGPRFRVRGRLNGVEFHSNTMPIGRGASCLGVHKVTREAAGAAFGNRVTVELEPDDAPREVALPDELAKALAGDPVAEAAFQRLSPSRRREHAESIAGAKRRETRERRLAAVLEQLRAEA